MSLIRPDLPFVGLPAIAYRLHKGVPLSLRSCTGHLRTNSSARVVFLAHHRARGPSEILCPRAEFIFSSAVGSVTAAAVASPAMLVQHRCRDLLLRMGKASHRRTCVTYLPPRRAVQIRTTASTEHLAASPPCVPALADVPQMQSHPASIPYGRALSPTCPLAPPQLPLVYTAWVSSRCSTKRLNHLPPSCTCNCLGTCYACHCRGLFARPRDFSSRCTAKLLQCGQRTLPTDLLLLHIHICIKMIQDHI